MADPEIAKSTALHISPTNNSSLSHRHGLREDAARIAEDAQVATEKEHAMSLWQGLKLYPAAIGWSVIFSAAIIMEGYDVVLMGGFYAYPSFREKFGDLQSDGSYELPASWQAGISNAMNVGQIFGLFANGIVSERFGYRRTMLAALAWIVGAIFILFFAPNKPALLVGELCIGVPLGVFQTLSVTYASEVCPVVLRCYLTTYVNLCWVIGQILGSAILRGLLSRTDQWGYRIPFALQWIWPIPIAIGVYFAPESPWWLVRTGQLEEAERALNRLASKNASVDFNAQETIAMMTHTNEMEKEMSAGTSYLDCFKGIDLRRTEVSCLTWAVQNLCGAGLMGYSTYFYRAAGLPEERSFDMSLAQYGLGFLGTLFSWVLMTHFGRRRLYVLGLWSLFGLLMIVGFVSLAPKNDAASWATGSILLVYTFVYDSTVGPVCYSLVSELPSTRLRNKTVVLARNLYNVFSIVNGVVIPYMLNPTEWNWAGKAGFFWGGLCFCSATWAFFRLPEPRGRTFGELDVLFEQKTPARKFKTAVVNQFETEHEKVLEQ